jgi:hypothetical protein
MIRTACVLTAAAALLTPLQTPVDAVTFVQAFRAGTADQFKNRVVAGTGVNFHGAINERIADGTTRPSLVITVGAERSGSTPALIKAWDEFVAAERERTTLVVALSGANLPVPAGGAGPQTYEFSGIYDGQVRTIIRVPQATNGVKPDPGPCKGEHALDGVQGSFYCAPLLVNATATVKP